MAIQRGAEVSMTTDTARGDGLDRLKSTRGSNRGVVTKLIKESESILNAEILTEDDFDRSETICEPLDEKRKTLECLDEDILKQVKIEDIDEEINEAADHLARILSIKRKITKKLSSKTGTDVRGEHETDRPVRPSPRLLDRHERETVEPFRPRLAFPNYESELPESRERSYPGYSGHQPRTPMSVVGTKSKLPKLYLPKFKGDRTKFTAFWDSFKSSVDDNRDISVVDKFNYLYSLLEGEALPAIQGLPPTAESYKIAVDTFHDRFGKTQQVIAAQMDELLKLSACQSVDRIGHLRYIFDQLNIHVRGLEALGVNSHQYGSLFIPIIRSKVPAEFRLIIARKTEHKVWEFQEILETLKAEVEARELSIRVKTNENFVTGENRKTNQ